MTLGEKKTVNISEKTIDRNRHLNTPTVYHIVIQLRACPYDSHM